MNTHPPVKVLRHWVHCMLIMIRRRKPTGWYAEKLSFILQHVVDDEEVERVREGREYVSDAFFLGVANLFDVDVVLLRHNASQPDQSIVFFSPIVRPQGVIRGAIRPLIAIHFAHQHY